MPLELSTVIKVTTNGTLGPAPLCSCDDYFERTLFDNALSHIKLRSGVSIYLIFTRNLRLFSQLGFFNLLLNLFSFN